MDEFIAVRVVKEEEAEEKETIKDLNIENLIVGLNKMYNLQNQILSEIKSNNILTQQLIQNIKDLRVTTNNVNSNVATTTEKVKAIFTEVKYNK